MAELAGELRDHIYKMHAYGPREHSHWVMSLEWFRELLKLDKPGPFEPPRPPVETLLGIPVKVRADGGPPHLELLPLEPL